MYSDCRAWLCATLRTSTVPARARVVRSWPRRLFSECFFPSLASRHCVCRRRTRGVFRSFTNVVVSRSGAQPEVIGVRGVCAVNILLEQSYSKCFFNKVMMHSPWGSSQMKALSQSTTKVKSSPQERVIGRDGGKRRTLRSVSPSVIVAAHTGGCGKTRAAEGPLVGAKIVGRKKMRMAWKGRLKKLSRGLMWRSVVVG